MLTFYSRYVHNNIFFSFAVDADLEQLSKKRSADINSKADNTTTAQNSSEKVSNDSTHENSGVSNGACDGSTTVEGNGVVESTPLLSSETQLAESEQATYASANNDLKGTKAYQEADVPGLYNLAMAIIDYRGHRVVAQVCIRDAKFSSSLSSLCAFLISILVQFFLYFCQVLLIQCF